MPNVFIIGATGSIGSAVARLALKEGFQVFGTARHSSPETNFKLFTMDITDDDSILDVARRLPTVDLLIFAQGQAPAKSLSETNRSHILSMLDIHVAGALICLKFLQSLLADNGCIIFISSIAAVKGSYDPAYAAAKGALSSLTYSLAKELNGKVRVNAIAPGLVEHSPVHQSMTEEHAARHTQKMFKGRLIQAEHIARLAMEIYRNVSIDGAVVPIDGGFHH